MCYLLGLAVLCCVPAMTGEWVQRPYVWKSVYLTPSHHKAVGLPQHATVYMIHTYLGQTLYRA